MRARIHPKRNEGDAIRIPASKSLSHRALIAAALSKGTSYIRNLVHNNDTKATMDCLKQLGAIFEEENGVLKVKGIHDFGHFDGSLVDCGESGSTLRFLIPLFSLCGKEVTFTGHGKLMERPQDVYAGIFEEQQLGFEKEGSLLKVRGPLHAGTYTIRGDISSQFITGLLFTLPLVDGDSKIVVREPYESKSYVRLTEDVLHKAGIHFEDNGNEILIYGNQSYQPITMDVAGDDSQAAFFTVLACVSKVPVTITGIEKESLQGDHVIFSLLKEMGAGVTETETGYRIEPGDMHGITVDLRDCPDLGPVLFALATQVHGTTVFTNIERLRIKESDRVSCMEEELKKLGCAMVSDEHTVTITGVTEIDGGVTLDAHNDHRIAMALSVLAVSAKKPMEILGADSINKSYPKFYADLRKAGCKVDLYDK